MSERHGAEISVMKYDGRFGHNEQCESATWFFTPERFGEVWKFKFPNGYGASVARTAIWDFKSIMRDEPSASTCGFKWGYYSLIKLIGEKQDLDFGTQSFLEFDDVKERLDKIESLSNISGESFC